jgi:hypothetical protein
VCGWWFVRNRLVYGQWNPVSVQAALAHNLRPGTEPFALLREWDGFIKSYWGVFGGFNVIFPDVVYTIFFGLTGLLVLAVAAFVIRRRRTLPPGLVCGVALVAVNLLAVAVWTSRLYGSQGRLMFPSLGVASAAAAVSLAACGRHRNRVAAGMVAVLAVAAACGALFVIPAQYP